MADEERGAEKDGKERKEGVRVQVAALPKDDVGKGVARVGRKQMEAAGVREGEVLEVEGKRTTAVIALRAYPSDDSIDVVRLDGLQRANAGVTIGDHVELRRAEVRSARRITLAPADRKSTRLNSSHTMQYRMPSSA